MPDQPTSPALSAAFAALVQALAVTGAEGPEPPAADRGVYQQNRWAALRYGCAARLLRPDEPTTATVRQLLSELLDRIEPAVRALGTGDLIARLDPRRSEGEEQVEIGRSNGLQAVCADLVRRSLASKTGAQ